MRRSENKSSAKVALLFTTYPVATETFLQREVEAIEATGRDWEVHSLWGGGIEKQTSQMRYHRFNRWRLWAVIFWLPYWFLRSPGIVCHMISLLFRKPRNTINYFENLLGLGVAVSEAHAFEKRKITKLHAVWASAPAMAGYGLSRLLKIEFSFAGHAYDLFEDGGDGWISEKIKAASFIRTSTSDGAKRLCELGADSGKVVVIRRGLNHLPDLQEYVPPQAPFKLLSVGRLVEKMGYERQLDLYRDLAGLGLEFQVRIIGGGPDLGKLTAMVNDYQLKDRITFEGALPFAAVQAALDEADLFVFTGKVARDGDRAGFPNAVGEAMAYGVPVVATSVGAVEEGIRDGVSGLILTGGDGDARLLAQLLSDPARMEAFRLNARQWIEANFRTEANVSRLIELIESNGCDE